MLEMYIVNALGNSGSLGCKLANSNFAYKRIGRLRHLTMMRREGACTSTLVSPPIPDLLHAANERIHAASPGTLRAQRDESEALR